MSLCTVVQADVLKGSDMMMIWHTQKDNWFWIAFYKFLWDQEVDKNWTKPA